MLLGPSGAGKSSLLNRLAGRDIQTTGPVREQDAKGRHTTTARELFRLPTGALVIDTPGLLAVGLAGEGDGLGQVFPDIMALGENCRFRNCRHQGEPGCSEAAAWSFFGGVDLKALAAFRPLTLEETLTICVKIAQSLGHIHAVNIIHKDLKPTNILYRAGIR